MALEGCISGAERPGTVTNRASVARTDARVCMGGAGFWICFGASDLGSASRRNDKLQVGQEESSSRRGAGYLSLFSDPPLLCFSGAAVIGRLAGVPNPEQQVLLMVMFRFDGTGTPSPFQLPM